MTGCKNYRPVHEHMAEVTAFHTRNGRMPKGGKMVSAEERSAHRSLTRIRRTPGIPAHWLPTVDTFASRLGELAAWMDDHNGLFPRNRPNTNEGRLRAWLEHQRQAGDELSAERRQLLDERIPGWDAEHINIGRVAMFYPVFAHEECSEVGSHGKSICPCITTHDFNLALEAESSFNISRAHAQLQVSLSRVELFPGHTDILDTALRSEPFKIEIGIVARPEDSID